MMWILLLTIAAATAEQITQYQIDYGTHVGNGTMVEDDNHQKIVFSTPTGEARMDTIVVDYNQGQILLKSDRRIQCVVASLNEGLKSKLEDYKNQVLTGKLVKALYFAFVKSKSSEVNTEHNQLVDEVCPEYDVIFVKSINANTVPLKTLEVCHGIATGTWCYGVGKGTNVNFGWGECRNPRM